MASALGVVLPSRRSSAAAGHRELATGLVVTGLLLWLAFHDGGYFPTTWNVCALALLGLLAVLLLWRREMMLGRLDVALLLCLSALTLWTWLSALWSIAPATSVLEGQRALLYLAGSGVLLVLVPRGGPAVLTGGVLAAAALVCGYALGARLGSVAPLPWHRLGGPVEYWNSLGLIAAVGIGLALAVVAHGRRALFRATAGATAPVLVCALYLTFSRGAWLALGLELLVLAGFDPRRRELAGATAALALPSAAVLGLAAMAHALTTPGAPGAAVTADAHRLGVAVLVSCGGSAYLALAAPRLGARMPHVRPRRAAVVLIACAVVTGAGVTITAGGPARLPGAALSAFEGSLPNETSNLTTHLFTLSGSGRAEMWRVAVKTWLAHPLFGSGAGTYNRLWLMYRKVPVQYEDAHSLYLETLTELGAGGLAILLLTLAIPLRAAWKLLGGGAASMSAYVPVLMAAYIACLAHAAIDWDWEMPIVTMTALLCGAALVVAARAEPRSLPRTVRAGGLALALSLGACAGVFLIGNRDLNAAEAAAAAGQNAHEASAARAAEAWMPWSPDPLHLLATLQLQRGNRTGARHLLAGAIARDPSDWTMWLEMAVASDGRARLGAIRTAAHLDPEADVTGLATRYGMIRAAPHSSRRSQVGQASE